MLNIKIVICLFLSIYTLSFSSGVFPGTKNNEKTDYSKQLNTLLNVKAQDFNDSYSFKIRKNNDYYNVIIKSKKSEKIKKIPESFVSKLFEQDDKNVEKLIIDIVFIPGKK